MLCLRLLLLLTVTAALTLAQGPLYTLKIDVPMVFVDATVLGPDNKPVTNLIEKDFVILEDGVPQQIRSFGSAASPFYVLLLFDRSGSTQSQWTLMQTAVARFLENLRKQDKPAIAAFDAEFEILSGWKDSPGYALKALDAL